MTRGFKRYQTPNSQALTPPKQNLLMSSFNHEYAKPSTDPNIKDLGLNLAYQNRFTQIDNSESKHFRPHLGRGFGAANRERRPPGSLQLSTLAAQTCRIGKVGGGARAGMYA